MLTMTGDIAAIITAGATLVTVIGNFILQVIQVKKSTDNGKKLDENTRVTNETALKVDDVHTATDVLTEISGRTDVKALRAKHAAEASNKP